jgi:hypothetical protein
MKEETVMAMEKGPGTATKRLNRTRDGIKLEVAIRVYAESIAQMIRANRPIVPNMLADEAWKCGEAFVARWDQEP